MSELTVTISPPESQALAAESEGSRDIAETIVIASPETYQWAGEQLREIKSKAKELDERRKKITKPLDEAKKQVMDLFRPALEFLTQAETIIKRKMIVYQSEQEKIRREAEAKAREAQRKEQERLEEQARKAEAKGKAEQAEALRQQADMTPAVVVAPEAPKANGTSIRTDWEAEVMDKKALIKAIAAGTAPDVLDVNMKTLNQMARALKDQLNIPGVRARQVERMAVRT